MKKMCSVLMSAIMAAALLVGCGNTKAPEKGQTSDKKVYKVGIVNYVDDASLNQIVSNLEQQLDAKGSELGVKFDYEPYYDNAQADSAVLNQIGADLVGDEVDIIVAVATPTALTMVSAVEDTDIPVIFAAVSDPVGAGLAKTMDAPGGRVTGTSDGLDAQALINLIFAAEPDAQKIGLLYDTAQDSSTAAIASAKTILDGMGVKYVEKTGSNTDEVLLAAQALVAEGVDAVFTPTDNTVMAAELSIYEVFAEAGIGHFCGADSFALNGAFVGYGVDYALLGRKTADIVADVLVNGKNPAEYPVATFDNGLVSVNTETCEALGYDLETIKTAYADLATGFTELTTMAEFNQ